VPIQFWFSISFIPFIVVQKRVWIASGGECQRARTITSPKIFSVGGQPVKTLAVRSTPFVLLVFFGASAFAKSTAPEVTFVSPCECIGFHGKNRWVAKTDLTPVPLDKSAIQSVTPSQIYAWEGLGGFNKLHRSANAVRAKMVRAYGARG
jgi:hypothetical protein